MSKRLLFLLPLLISLYSIADEGMWMPHQLKSRENSMKERGLNMPVEEIYSETGSSLKDAVVLFGGGCTGEIISEKGLVLTNHHCGYSQIQSLSTMENNYVEKGFWALHQSQEIPCPGLTVTFIVRIENVTAQVLGRSDSVMNAGDEDKRIEANIKQAELSAKKEKWQQAKIKSFYYGNEYYLFVTEIYRDIRFVGAPPSSIGRFGGDADNWMWPRHTGDFSLFRVYADSTNKPSDYNPQNVPYQPKRFFTINAGGVKENDFTMVFGFPGKTTEYIPSYAVDLIQHVNDPARVNIRERKLSVWRERMLANDTIDLKYVSKYGSIANAWKKWKGEMQGLQRKNVIAGKKEFEAGFTSWIGRDNRTRDAYAGVLHEMELFYADIRPVSKLMDYYNEAILGVELFAFLNSNIRPLSLLAMKDNVSDDSLKTVAGKVNKNLSGVYKNYDAKTDELLLAAMLRLYHDSINPAWHPDFYGTIQSKYKNDYHRYTEMIFKKSVFTDPERLSRFLQTFSKRSAKKIMKDPAYKVFGSFADIFRKEGAEKMDAFNDRIASLQSRYMKAQMEMLSAETLYPDANLTMRITYGQVKGYSPRDGVSYGHQSYLKGIMEKYIPGHYDFDVPEKLRQLYDAKDFGTYAVNGDVPVAFIANNHTTGGNSGSPVINAKGELIGTNFDRVWEGTMSDIEFDPSICRNITLDIRYTLFMIEKLGGATNIINELRIVR